MIWISVILGYNIQNLQWWYTKHNNNVFNGLYTAQQNFSTTFIIMPHFEWTWNVLLWIQRYIWIVVNQNCWLIQVLGTLYRYISFIVV